MWCSSVKACAVSPDIVCVSGGFHSSKQIEISPGYKLIKKKNKKNCSVNNHNFPLDTGSSFAVPLNVLGVHLYKDQTVNAQAAKWLQSADGVRARHGVIHHVCSQSSSQTEDT